MFDSHLPLRRTMARLAIFFAGATPSAASAHEGPPFPIVMDEPVAGYVVSVWADPDIGEAEFYAIVETPDGTVPQNAPKVSMWTEPISKRLDRVEYPMNRELPKGQMQFRAEPYFDQRDQWTVGFRLTNSMVNSGEVSTQIESTPPGYGPWDLAIYLFPFVLLGALWTYAMLRRRRAYVRADAEYAPDASTE